jgi:hypothetical protein
VHRPVGDPLQIYADRFSGHYDVVFCDPVGKKDTNGMLHEAQSYTDAAWSPTLRRTKDYNKAISILENYLEQDSNANSSFFLLPNLCEYKAERDGLGEKKEGRLQGEVVRAAGSPTPARIIRLPSERSQ